VALNTTKTAAQGNEVLRLLPLCEPWPLPTKSPAELLEAAREVDKVLKQKVLAVLRRRACRMPRVCNPSLRHLRTPSWRGLGRQRLLPALLEGPGITLSGRELAARHATDCQPTASTGTSRMATGGSYRSTAALTC